MTTRSTRRGQSAATAIEYPDTDGKPMAETPLHRNEGYRIIYTLQDAYARRPDVYVSGNMMLYYREGDPRDALARRSGDLRHTAVARTARLSELA